MTGVVVVRRATTLGAVVALVAGVMGSAAGAPVTSRAGAEVFTHRECSWGDFGRGLIHTSALGSPRRPVAGVPQAGVVEVHPDNWSADEPAMVLTSTSVGVPAEPMGHFGAAVVGAQVSFPDYCADLVIGVPGADGGRGAVIVVPDLGSGFDATRAVRLPTSTLGLQPGDALGTAIGVVQSGNGALIVAGAPGRDLANAPNAGELVSWLLPASWDSPTSPAASPAVPAPAAPVTYVQGSGGILGRCERADRFGSVISSDPQVSRYGYSATLAVGIPKEDIGSRTNAGAVALLTFTDGALTGNDLVWQGHGLPGKSRTGDTLGAAVTYRGDRRAFGIPGKNANGRKDSGAVIVWQRDPADPTEGAYRVITQNTRGVPDWSERGDRFGAALAVGAGMAQQETSTIAVGAPGEDLRGRRNVGAVTWLTWMSEDDPPHFAYSTLKVGGLAKGDAFGSRLVVVSDYSDMEEDTRDILYVGAPGEDRPGARNAGRYHVTTYPNLIPTAVPYADGLTAYERFGG